MLFTARQLQHSCALSSSLAPMQDLYANNQQLATHIGSLFRDLLSEGRAVKPQQASLESLR